MDFIQAILFLVFLICLFFLMYQHVVYFLFLKLPPFEGLAKESWSEQGAESSLKSCFALMTKGQVMGEKHRNIDALKARHPNLEILAFDGGSTDDTFKKNFAYPDLLTAIRGVSLLRLGSQDDKLCTCIRE